MIFDGDILGFARFVAISFSRRQLEKASELTVRDLGAEFFAPVGWGR